AGDESATQLFVYDVKNIKSIDLADYLSQIFLGSSSTGGSRRSDTSGAVAPGLAAATIGSAGATGASDGRSGSGRSSRFGNRTSSQPRSGAATGAVAGNGDSGIRITAVEEN